VNKRALKLVEALATPHGIDRYLELVHPMLTVRELRAVVTDADRSCADSVTLTLRPTRQWRGFRAGQFVQVAVDVDGVRYTRCYSPSCSQYRSDGRIELTVKAHAQGVVSQYLDAAARPGLVIGLSQADGSFRLPQPRPAQVLLISGGSGITPVLSMLRTLVDEGHDGEAAFLHFARTEADWLYEPELRALAARHPRLRTRYETTRGTEPRRLDAAALRAVMPGPSRATAAACGPPSLVDAAAEVWAQVGGDPRRLLTETFTPPRVLVTGGAASGRLRFVRSDRTAEIGEGTLLEQAEAAGLSPAFGCRMGICHTCTCRKAAGAVRNLRTGEVSDEENEDIQLCISAPAGDVALEL
jgi:stearoyl-CoA 9-desaturase NADPH oxidoreductase